MRLVLKAVALNPPDTMTQSDSARPHIDRVVTDDIEIACVYIRRRGE